ncbi:MAG: AMP-binding protein, partial [Actinobacteria bacterium]|nr:AMP-binding protein [Actinomycetota bacterium]
PRDEFLGRVYEAARILDGAPTLAVVADATMTTVITIVAALEAGVPVVPLSPDAGEREREHVLADSGAGLLAEGGTTWALPGNDAVPRGDAALVLYTSGTTGPPKGVPIRLDAIRSCISGLADAWDWTPDDVLVHGLPLHHVHGLVLGVLGPLITGSGLVHTGRPTPAAYAAARGSLYFGVPTVWSRIARDADAARALGGARLLVSGSAALPGPVFDALRALAGQPPIERYGMTETLITLTARAADPRQRGSVGRPLAGIRARIVDDAGASSRPGELGELQVIGSSLFTGYLNRPDATAAAFTVDGWFRTGDIATVDADGVHRIVGRASTDLIKSGGYRIGAGEVEDALLAHPDVVEAAVVGEPDDDLGERIVAYVVTQGVGERELIAHVAATLSAHKRPRTVVLVDALPRNAMGKVDKARLGHMPPPTMAIPATNGDQP